jgi:hypothetical protein
MRNRMDHYRITDDSGFLAIVNPARYHSFVNSDWEFEELMQRFKIEMRNNNLIIWSSGGERTWKIQVLEALSDRKAFRQFDKLIEVTENQLLLINYEDITMAAQFEGEPLVTERNKNQLFDIKNGVYNVTIRQMFDPENLEAIPSDEKADFEIIFTSFITEGDMKEHNDTIIWWPS